MSDRSISPEEAFATLGNKTRLSILHELWSDTGSSVAFSELRDRVGHDDKGNFRYHLNRLVDHFVNQVEGGYSLTNAGESAVRAVVKGSLTSVPTIDPVELDQSCPFCGAAVELQYQHELNVRCTECPGLLGDSLPPGTFMHFPFPPAGLRGRSPEQILVAAYTLYYSKVWPLFDGVCPECAGRAHVSVEVCPDHDPVGVCSTCGTASEIWAAFECTVCGYAHRTLVWFAIMNQPELVSFYRDSGIVEETAPFRAIIEESTRYLERISQTVVTTDPFRMRVNIDYGESQLTVSLDETLDFVDVERC